MARPTSFAKLTGTALPICLYTEVTPTTNCQSSGKV